MATELLDLVRTSLIEVLDDQHKAVRELTESLDEAALWQKPVEPGNSIGHLILHLTGNLNYLVGANLGGTGYVRDREREFTETDRPTKAVLLANLDAAVATFRRVVGSLSAEQLMRPHPTARLGLTLKALDHLVAHFALHRGQLSYLARLVRR